MSTLKVTHLQNENGSGPAMSVAVGGGVTFAGISTFHNGVDSGERLTIGGSNVTDVNLLTLNGSGATQNVGLVLNKTNSPAKAYGMQVNNGTGDLIFYDYTATQERVRITGVGSFGVGNDDPTYRVSVKDTKADGTGVQMHLWNNSTNNTAGNVWTGIRFTGSTGDYETSEIKSWRVHPGTGLNSLSINTGGVERMVMSSGGVGIGTSNPIVPLHIFGTNGLIAEDSTNQKRAEFRSKNNIVELNGYDPANSNAGVPIVFKQYTSECARFDTNRNLVFPNGKGIDFSAHTDQATGESNVASVLDDYEEGTWDPTISQGWTVTNYDAQHGWYIKVGNLVTASASIQFDGTSTSNQIRLSIPFVPGGHDDNNARSMGTIGFSNASFTSNSNGHGNGLYAYPDYSNYVYAYLVGGSGGALNSTGNATNVWLEYQVTFRV